MLYMISYDLMNPGQDYSKITEELERLGASKILYSQWVARLTNTSASKLRDYLFGFMDKNDRLFVCCLEAPRDGIFWSGQNLLSKIGNI